MNERSNLTVKRDGREAIRIDDFACAQKFADEFRPDDLHRILDRYAEMCCPIYDKFGRVLRIETTSNDVSFFKHHRKVEHRDGTENHELAPLKKSIYSLIDLREIFLGCNRRYLEFISSLDDHSGGQSALKKLTEPKTENGTTWKGINFFDPKDQSLLRGIQHPEFNIRGLRRADLKKVVPALSDSALSRQLKRMRVFGLIKRVAGTYRYYMTKLGRVTVATCECLTEFTIVPALAAIA